MTPFSAGGNVKREVALLMHNSVLTQCFIGIYIESFTGKP